MRLKTKRMCLLLSAVLAAALLGGCGCKHEWQDGTCQAPKTCVLCGKTEGKIRGHKYGNTACDAPEGCIVCGTLEGIELTHQWREDCKICIRCGHDERPAEDRFPDVLAKSLEEKWSFEAELKAKVSGEEGKEYVLTRADWETVFDSEYSLLAPFKEEKFEDEALKELALSYIKSVEESIEALEHLGTDRWEDEYRNGVYWDQANILYLVNEQYPITVGDEHRETLDKILTNGEIINMVRPLLEQILFLHIDTTAAGKFYETTVENTSTLTFLWFSLDVNLLDESGEVVETENIKVDIWEPGEKRRFNFYAKEEFSSIDVAFANWQLPD